MPEKSVRTLRAIAVIAGFGLLASLLVGVQSDSMDTFQLFEQGN
jgi:hypothetical protein